MDTISVRYGGGVSELEAPHFDTLKGKRLHAGEVLAVLWPDGTRDTRTVAIDRRFPPYASGGKVFQAYDDRAFIEHTVNGAPLRIYLRWAPTIRAERVGEPGGF